MLLRRHFLLAAFTAFGASLVVSRPAFAAGFDHSHAAWTVLLRRHVVVLQGGQASQLRYAALQGERATLKRYLDTLSSVGAAQFDAWAKPQQMAFLINAYNAFTVELILTRYPDLKSIKELGGLLQSPWKQKFVPLLGSRLSLDNIEHDMLRERGRFDDPRLHFAVNCASIGCPALREEAFVAERLDAQLEEQTRRFLADRSRNRFNAATGKLEVSRILDWYGADFRLGHRGIASEKAFFARYANQLTDVPSEREVLRAQQAGIAFLDYDWNLNDTR